MGYMAKNVDIERATSDLRNRTLSGLPGDFSRLVYLASSRDYNTGRYYHDGLAFHFTEMVVSKAFAECHREVFERLLHVSLEELTEELRNYIASTQEIPEDFLRNWQRLETYRITIPSEYEEMEARFFLSNVKMALAVLEARQESASHREQSA
jgi:hypothetical protein